MSNETTRPTHLMGLRTLVMMQLKDKLNLSFVADKKGSLTKLLLRFILFVGVTAIIYILLSLLNRLSVFTVISNNLPVPMFNLIFIAMITLSTVSCIGSLTKSLYFSRDNLTLLSYPVKANTVFLSKLIVYYILSLLREITFILPLFLAYGIACGFPFYYFIWAIFMFFIICAVPVSISGLVSIPWMYISMFFRKRPLTQDITLASLLLIGTVILFVLIDHIPEDMHFLMKWNEIYLPSIYQFSRSVQRLFLPFFYLSACVIGCDFDTLHGSSVGRFNAATAPIFFIIVASVALLVFLANLLARPLFFKMAAKPFEYNKMVFSHEYKLKVKKNAFGNYAIVARRIKKNGSGAFILKEFKNAITNLYLTGYKLKKNFTEKEIFDLVANLTKFDLEIIPFKEFIKKSRIGFIVEYRTDGPYLIVASDYNKGKIVCFDPNYSRSQNRKKPSFFSLMWKDILVYIRTPGSLVKYFLMLIVCPLAIALINKLFRSINTSFMGDQFVVMFNILMMIMIPLVSNVSVASVYSREGESSYLLKASPSNYAVTLTAKLVLRWFMVFISMIAATVVYSHYCDVFFNRPWYLFTSVMLVYTGHLIWSAELDYMNPQDQLYKEIGEGNIANPNESLSGLLAFLISFAFTGISLFLMFENSITVFYKLLTIAVIFFAARLCLALFRIQGFSTSRGERGRQ